MIRALLVRRRSWPRRLRGPHYCAIRRASPEMMTAPTDDRTRGIPSFLPPLLARVSVWRGPHGRPLGRPALHLAVHVADRRPHRHAADAGRLQLLCSDAAGALALVARPRHLPGRPVRPERAHGLAGGRQQGAGQHRLVSRRPPHARGHVVRRRHQHPAAGRVELRHAPRARAVRHGAA